MQQKVSLHQWETNIERVNAELRHRIAVMDWDDPVLSNIYGIDDFEWMAEEIERLSKRYKKEGWQDENLMRKLKVRYSYRKKQRYTIKDDKVFNDYCDRNNLAPHQIVMLLMRRAFRV
jgi:hypothetical protein